MPEEKNDVVRNLINGLVRERAEHRYSGEVGARRYLIRTDAGWHPAIWLSADGVFSNSFMKHFSTEGRARATPSGELSRHLSGELALFEPPGEEDHGWRVRALVDLRKPILDFPFTTAATADVVQDHRKKPMTWPKGEAISSDILTFVSEDVDQPFPTRLRLIGSGSVRHGAGRLFVGVPKEWCANNGGEALIPDVHVFNDIVLFTITQATRFREPQTDDVYLVEPAADATDQGILAVGDTCLEPLSPDDPRVQLCRSTPSIRIREYGRNRQLYHRAFHAWPR